MTESSPGRRLAANLALAAVTVALLTLTLELAFRLFPALLPHGTYGGGRLHPDLGWNVHGQTLVYNVARLVERVPNAEGFLDVEHDPAKPAGVRRVGFFGDSYVEAQQVPLEAVFHRRLEQRMRADGVRVESLGFGLSGWGTLHSLLSHRVFGPRYDVDVVVYVFVENDLGDQLYDLEIELGTAARDFPYATLSADGSSYQVVRLGADGAPPSWYATAKLLQRRSLLAHVLWSRVRAFQTRGVKMRATPADVEMTRTAGATPRAEDLASTWPSRWAEPARRLAELVLRDLQHAVTARGAALAVLYVPRGEAQLRGDFGLEHTWLPWLEQTCAALGIPLLDPSDALRARMERGDTVYDDHWTPAGHEAVAGFLADARERWLP